MTLSSLTDLSPVFWALRGGGAGSWGVIISATFKTLPIFPVAQHQAVLNVNSTADVNKVARIHAKHIFDWENFNAGQYFFWTAKGPSLFNFFIDTRFPNTTVAAANASITPFLADLLAHGYNYTVLTLRESNVNDISFMETDDTTGRIENVIGTRLWPDEVYRNNVTEIGNAYQTLFDSGAAVYVVGIFLIYVLLITLCSSECLVTWSLGVSPPIFFWWHAYPFVRTSLQKRTHKLSY